MMYALHGLRLDSSVPLPELSEAEVSGADPGGAAGTIAYRESLGAGPYPGSPPSILSCALPDGRPFLTVAKTGGRFLVRFPGRADFLVTAIGDEIRCVHGPAGSPETIRHLLLDHLLPLVLNLRGLEVLHASGSVVNGRAVLFAGPSGSGKSTLAAALARAGCSMLSDDCVVLRMESGQVQAVPAYGGFRMWDDAADWIVGRGHRLPPVADYSAKKRWIPGAEEIQAADRPAPVAKIWFVSHADYGEEPGATPLSPAETLAELLARSYRMDLCDLDMLRRQFRFLADVAESVSAGRLRLAALPSGPEAVVKMVQAEMASAGPCTV